jgi:hypothetical protein
MRTPSAKPEPEYVDYVLRLVFLPTMADKMVISHEDNSKYPVVVTDAYVPNTALATANVTIKGVVYTFPKDFDYDYTFHSELNEVIGYGYDMIKETLYFKNLPGHPTLMGRAELKASGLIYSPSLDLSHVEVFGNFQLTGTGIFKNVKGSGIAMMGVSTGYVVYHLAWIKGWPL